MSPARRRTPAHPGGGARARPPQRPRRRGRQAAPDRVEPAPRDVDHAELHARGGAAARPDPGGEPRADPRGREVRLQSSGTSFRPTQPGGSASRSPVRLPTRGARSACPSHVAEQGAPGDARPPAARPAPEPAIHPTRRSARRPGCPPSGSRSCSRLVTDPVSLETPVGDGESLYADLIEDERSESPTALTDSNARAAELNGALEALEPRNAACAFPPLRAGRRAAADARGSR